MAEAVDVVVATTTDVIVAATTTMTATGVVAVTVAVAGPTGEMTTGSRDVVVGATGIGSASVAEGIGIARGTVMDDDEAPIIIDVLSAGAGVAAVRLIASVARLASRLLLAESATRRIFRRL